MAYNPFAIEGFKYRLVQGGVRPAYFVVNINTQVTYGGAVSDDLLPFNSHMFYLCRAAQLPGVDLDNVKVHFQGREVNIPGSKRYAPVTLRFLNDPQFSVRKRMETWVQRINNTDLNVRAQATDGLLGTVTVTQYSAEQQGGLIASAAGTLLDLIGGTTAAKALNGVKQFLPPKKLREYKFIGAYPRSIAAIDLNQDAGDTFEEFDVTFEYQYWKTSEDQLIGVGGIGRTEGFTRE